MTSANLLVVLVVGTIIGALSGLVIGLGTSSLYLAFAAGFLATIIAGIVRHMILGSAGARTPSLVIVYSAIASLGASALAMEVARLSGLATSPVWIGTLAGLFSVILMAMLLLTYHAQPGEPPMPLKR